MLYRRTAIRNRSNCGKLVISFVIIPYGSFHLERLMKRLSRSNLGGDQRGLVEAILTDRAEKPAQKLCQRKIDFDDQSASRRIHCADRPSMNIYGAFGNRES